MKNFSEYLDDRVKGKEKLPLFFHEKEASYNFFIENKIDTVKKLKVFKNKDAFDLSGLPAKFVIKPSFLSSSLGVMVLENIGNGLFFDSLSKKKLSKEDVFRIQGEYLDKSSKESKSIIIEEKVEDYHGYNIPLDYKFYCFGDEVGMMGLFNRNDKSKLFVDWYDENLEPSNEWIVNGEPYTYASEKPLIIDNKKEIITFARDVASKISLPFVSLDIYNSTRGPLLGEVTLSPGGLHYQKFFKILPDANIKMGKLWAAAISRGFFF